MNILLAILGSLSIGGTAVSPILIDGSNTTKQIKLANNKISEQKKLDFKFSGWADKDKKFIGGDCDYTESLVKQYDKLQQWIIKNNVSNVNVKSTDSKFQDTASYGQLDLAGEVKWLFTKDVKIISAIAHAESLGYGEWAYSNLVKFSINGQEQTKNFDGYLSGQEFSDFQLMSRYSINIYFDYEVNKDISYTDGQYLSDIRLPNIGIKFNASDIKTILSYSESQYSDLINNYINSVIGSTISHNTIENVSKAVKDSEGYKMGEVYADTIVVKEQVFYVSFTSTDATGTFNMLVSY